MQSKNYNSSLGLGGLYLLASIPIAMLVAYFLGGERALVATALIFPVLILAVSRFQSGLFASRMQQDMLTGLPLRSALTNWLDASRAMTQKPGEQIAVMALSVDGLDSQEERFGSGMRDAILSQATKRLQGLLRHDDFIVRLGEDGFGIGLRNVRTPAIENLLELSKRLQSCFDEPFSDGQSLSYCSISIGIASEIQVKKLTGDNLLEAGLRANDLAALAGNGSIRVYSEGLSSATHHERDTARELCNALETGEIRAWFQPQFCLKTGAISGCEALARWEHQDKGLISPARFLPDIEKSGLSQRLAEVMLKQSLSALVEWDEIGFQVPSVSVNFTGEDLRNPRLADYIRWELDRHGLEPHRLTVEVLESVVSESSEDMVARTLTELSIIGCGIDLDDFGTGFTSIANIQRFNVSRIKIDRCLITHLDKKQDQRRMVAALLALSDNLEVETLAEGVETEGEIAALRELGCASVQGYAFARPMPGAELTAWISERQGYAEGQSGALQA